MSATIELSNLEVRLGGRTILHSLSGTMAGRAIGLLGPNGSGKSTLIKAPLGFHPARAGTASVLGLDLHTQIRAIRSLVGYMLAHEAFAPPMPGTQVGRHMADL